MPKCPNKHIFIGFAKITFFIQRIFAPTVVRRSGGYGPKKLINTILAVFGFVPSKKYDFIVFRPLFACNFVKFLV